MISFSLREDFQPFPRCLPLSDHHSLSPSCPLEPCLTLYYSNYSHYSVAFETSCSRFCANSGVSADLGNSGRMMAHLNAAILDLCTRVGGRGKGAGRVGCGLTLGAGLSSAQVINTLINSSAQIILKTTRREWWGRNILMEFVLL